MDHRYPYSCASLLMACILALMATSKSQAESLQEAWNVGLAVDQQLEASRWQSSAAQRGLYAAKAERWASVDGTASYYAMNKPVGVVASLPAPMGDFSMNFLQREGLVAGAHVTQPLYTFGRIQNGIDAAGADVTAASASEVTSELDVLLRVSTAYIDVLRAQRNVEVVQQSVASLESHVRDVATLVKQGVRVLNDQLAAEVELSNAQQQLLRMQSRLDIAKASYNRSVGRPLDTFVSLEEVSEPAGTYDLEQLTQEALANRPEIATLSATARSLRSRAGGIDAGYKPQLTVKGGVDYIENRYFTDQTFSSVMLMGQWNFFDSGKKKHTVAKLEQTAEALLRERNDLESRIRLQVRDAWSNLQTTRQRVQVNRKALSSADENLRVTRRRYDQGAGTNTEVLDAETLRTRTYGNYYESLYDAGQALIQLSRAVGSFDRPMYDLQPAAATSVDAPPTPPQPQIVQ